MADLQVIAEIFDVSLPVLLLALAWSIVWKGIALWKSARKSHLIWFVVLLVVNTLGILEILYIFLFSKMKIEKKQKKRKKKRR